MIVIGACGRACEKCPFYGDECGGCLEEMKHSSRYQCKAYNCVASKGLDTCLECEEFSECTLVSDHRVLCPLIIIKSTRREDTREMDFWSSAH